MGKDIDECVEEISAWCIKLNKIHNEDRLKIDVDDAIKIVDQLERNINDFGIKLKVMYTDEEKLNIPSIKDMFNQMIDKFKLLEQEQRVVDRYRMMFKKNNMVTPNEYADIPRTYKAIVNLLVNIIDLNNKIQDFIDKSVDDLDKLNDDIGKESKTRKLFNKLKRAW